MIRRRFLSLAWQIFSKSVVDTIHFYCPAGAEKSRNDRLIEHVKQLLKIKVGGYYDGLFVYVPVVYDAVHLLITPL